MQKRRLYSGTAAVSALVLAVCLMWFSKGGDVPSPMHTGTPTATGSAALPDAASGSATVELGESGTSTEPASGHGLVAGKAFTMDGTPVAAAHAWLARVAEAPTHEPSSAEVQLKAATDDAGRFEFSGLAAGRYRLELRAGDLVGGDGVVLLSDDSAAHLTVRMRSRDTSVAGLVAGEGGAPIPGARVRLVTHDGEELSVARMSRWDVVTGVGGEFQFEGLEPGAWQAYVTADDYAPLYSEPFNTGDREIRLTLNRGGRVEGRALIGDSTAPATGLPLRATHIGATTAEPATATTDAAGRFEFSHLMPGLHILATADPETVLLDGSVRVDVQPSKPTAGLVLRVGGSSRVKGRVYDEETGEGIAGVEVTAAAAGAAAPDRWIKSEPTDGAGLYEIGGLTAGPYELTVHRPAAGYAQPSIEHRAELQFEIALGAVIEGKDIPLSRTSPITGVVVDENGQPAPGARVTAEATDGFQRRESFSTETGAFTLGFSPESEVYLRAASLDRRSALEGPIVVPEDGMADLRLVLDEPMDAGLAGTVVDRLGNPMAAVVTARPTDMSPDEDARRFEVADANGQFLITGLAPGDYELFLAPRTGSFMQTTIAAQSIHLDAAEMHSGLRLVYDDSEVLKISGRVTDAAGIAIEGVDIIANSPDCPGNRAVTDREGRYTVLNVCEGANLVVAQHPQYGKQYIETVEAGTNDADFVMVGRGRLSGNVVDSSTGKPVTDFQITTQPFAANLSFQSVSDPDGGFAVDVDPGSVRLLVRAPGYDDRRVTVRPPMEPGEDREGILVELTRTGEPAAAPERPTP